MARERKVRGHLDRVLVAHDAGWYNVGQPGGGTYRPYDTLFTQFIPALKEARFSDEEIHRITVENPARAFTVGVPGQGVKRAGSGWSRCEAEWRGVLGPAWRW